MFVALLLNTGFYLAEVWIFMMGIHQVAPV